MIWTLFKLLAEHNVSEVPDGWRLWLLVGIPQILEPETFAGFRFLCKSSIFQKWYLKNIITVVRKDRLASNVCRFGFRNGLGTMHVTEMLRRCLFLSYGWGTPVYIVSLGVITAFDLMKYDVSLDATLQQLVGNTAMANVDCIATSGWVGVYQAGRQGDTDTTELWNALIEALLGPLVAYWADNDFGFTMDWTKPIHHAIWADNVFLTASSYEQMIVMIEGLTTGVVCGGSGMDNWKP